MFFKYKNFSLDGGANTSAVLVDGSLVAIRGNGGAEKVTISGVASAPVVGLITEMNAKAACYLSSTKDICMASADTIKIE